MKRGLYIFLAILFLSGGIGASKVFNIVRARASSVESNEVAIAICDENYFYDIIDRQHCYGNNINICDDCKNDCNSSCSGGKKIKSNAPIFKPKLPFGGFYWIGDGGTTKH